MKESSAIALFELESELTSRVMSEWLAAKKKSKSKRGKQKWNVVSKSKLERVWNSFMDSGFVRDEAALDDIATQVIANAVKLHVNTVLMGHTNESVSSYLGRNEFEDITEEEAEELIDGFEDFAIAENGQWRISDKSNKILDFALEIIDTIDSNKKLVAVDKLLNLIHARTDLAASFVEGGRNTLSQLSASPSDQ